MRRNPLLTRWISAWTLSLALCFAYLPLAAAQDSEGSQEYREYVRAALREYQVGNFNEARAFFAQAHALSPSARTYRGLGMCSYELRSYVDAIDWFDKALSSTERPLTEPMRLEILGLLRQARTFVTRIQIKVQPTWAKLRIDGRPTERDSSGRVAIDPGTHELVVEAADHDSVTRTVRTAGSESLALSFTLTPQRKLEAAPETPAPTRAPPEATKPPEVVTRSSSSVGPWIVIGASTAVAATGAVLLALALSNKSAVENPEGDRPRYDRSADDKVLPFSAIGISALALGSAGLIGGIVWKISDSGETESQSAALQLHVLPSSVRLRARF